jgi:hypothetical protein
MVKQRVSERKKKINWLKDKKNEFLQIKDSALEQNSKLSVLNNTDLNIFQK